jgi:hypothetical protein
MRYITVCQEFKSSVIVTYNSKMLRNVKISEVQIELMRFRECCNLVVLTA